MARQSLLSLVEKDLEARCRWVCVAFDRLQSIPVASPQERPENLRIRSEIPFVPIVVLYPEAQLWDTNAEMYTVEHDSVCPLGGSDNAF